MSRPSPTFSAENTLRRLMSSHTSHTSDQPYRRTSMASGTETMDSMEDEEWEGGEEVRADRRQRRKRDEPMSPVAVVCTSTVFHLPVGNNTDTSSLCHGIVSHLSDSDPIRRHGDTFPSPIYLPSLSFSTQPRWIQYPFRHVSTWLSPAVSSPTSSHSHGAHFIRRGLDFHVEIDSRRVGLPTLSRGDPARYPHATVTQHATPCHIRPRNNSIPSDFYHPTFHSNIPAHSAGYAPISARRVLPRVHVCRWSGWSGVCDGFRSRMGRESRHGLDIRTTKQWTSGKTIQIEIKVVHLSPIVQTLSPRAHSTPSSNCCQRESSW